MSLSKVGKRARLFQEKWEKTYFFAEASTFSINKQSVLGKNLMQDAYVKQTIMRIMKIAQKKHMEMMHDKMFNDLKKEVRTKISVKAIF